MTVDQTSNKENAGGHTFDIPKSSETTHSGILGIQTTDVRRVFFFVTLSMLATALRPLARIARMGFLNFDSLIPLVI